MSRLYSSKRGVAPAKPTRRVPSFSSTRSEAVLVREGRAGELRRQSRQRQAFGEEDVHGDQGF